MDILYSNLNIINPMKLHHMAYLHYAIEIVRTIFITPESLSDNASRLVRTICFCINK